MLLIFSGICLIFLIILLFFQIKFILSDITTSEYLRKDKYTENFNDEGCKKNFIKFLKGWDNENNYIYNDNARDLIMKNVTIEKYYLDLLVKSRIKNRKESNEYGVNRITERLDSIECNTSQLDNSNVRLEKEHFETGENEDSNANTIN